MLNIVNFTVWEFSNSKFYCVLTIMGGGTKKTEAKKVLKYLTFIFIKSYLP